MTSPKVGDRCARPEKSRSRRRRLVSAAPSQLTVRELKGYSLPPLDPLSPEDIKRIRESLHVSQAAFAQLINTSVSTVQKWEIGQKRPNGTGLKLLHLIQARGLAAVAETSFR